MFDHSFKTRALIKGVCAVFIIQKVVLDYSTVNIHILLSSAYKSYVLFYNSKCTSIHNNPFPKIEIDLEI